jgi:hypothetical protein
MINSIWYNSSEIKCKYLIFIYLPII